MSRVKVSSPRIELAALRGMLNQNVKVSSPLYSGLNSSYFSSPEAIELFDTIKEYASREGKAPKYKLLIDDPQLSKDARSFLRDSEAIITTREESNRALKVLTKYKQIRELARAVHIVNDGLTDPKIKIEGLLDQVATIIGKARSSHVLEASFLHFGKGSNSHEMIDFILNGDRTEQVIPTGLQTYDSVNGGWIRGSLVTIGGNSGGGKSQLAASIGESVANIGYKVALIPLEMSDFEMSCRFFAKIAKIDSMKIMQGKLTKEEKRILERRIFKWEKITAKRGGRYTIYKPTGDVSIEEAYDGIEAFGPDMSILDYISLLRERPGVDQWKQLGSDARYAKVNAEQRNRVNVLLCQINEEGKIRYARAVSEHSSNSWIFIADEDSKEQGIIKINQPKSRNQNNFPFTLKINYSTSSVTDMEGWADQQHKSESAKDEEVGGLANLAQEVD